MSERREPDAPMFSWDEDSHPLEASWGYQREFVPAMFRPSAEVVLGRVPPEPGARVLDAGCGTGALALAAVERVGPDGTVAGLDLNPAQLAVARELDADGRVDWREGDVAALPFEDASFDVVYCQHVLQFVPDRVAALRELARVSAGLVAVAVWGPIERNPVFAALARAFEERGDAENAAIVRSPRVFEQPEALLELAREAGLAGAEAASLDVPVRMPSVRRLLEELPPPVEEDAGEAERAERESVLARAVEVLEPLGGAEAIAFDDRLHLVVAPAP